MPMKGQKTHWVNPSERGCGVHPWSVKKTQWRAPYTSIRATGKKK
jgi:hypothetical protein